MITPITPIPPTAHAPSTAPIHRVGRRCSRHLLLRTLLPVWLACLAWLASPARAQGTSGQLPDPITSQELQRWLNRYVSPTPEQWAAIDVFHDQYKEEFARLREGDIEKFLKDTKSMQGRLPEREALKALLADWRRLEQRISALDARLFDNIQTTLAEPQMLQFPRARVARQRAVHRNPMLVGLAGSMPADLAEIVDGLDLDRDRFHSLDPILVPYEQQLAKRLGELSESGASMMSDLVDQLAAAGFAEIDNEALMKDPERLKAFMEAMQTAFRESGRKSREKGAEIAKLNHGVRKQIAAALPEDKALRFRREFVDRTYPGIGSQSETDRLLGAARRLRALDDGQRAALDALRTTWRMDDEKLELEQIELQDRFALEASPFDIGGEDGRLQREEMEAVADRRRKASAAVIENAKAIVGPELAERIDALARGAGEDGEAFAAEEGGSAAAAPTEPPGPEAMPSWSGDQFLPTQLAASDIADWSRRLGLDDGRKAILESLHADYLESWQSSVKPRIDAIQEAQRVAWRHETDAEGNPVARASASAIEDTFRARRAALAEVRAVEQKFFDDVKHAAVEPDKAPVVDALALGRLARVSGQMFFGMFEDSKESDVDFVGVVADALGDDRFEAIAVPVLLGKADVLVAASRELTDRMMDNQLQMEVLGARMQESGREGAVDAMVEYQQRLTDLSSATNAAVEKRRVLVRELLEEVCSRLPPEDAGAVRKAYARAAFPNVYNDRWSAAPLLERAGQVGGLSEAQAGEIKALGAEFDAAYEALSERMVAIARDSTGVVGGDPEGWQKWQDRRNRMDRIRFERDELSMKTVRRLSTILGPELAARVPGLAQYEKIEDRSRNPFGP